MSRLYVFKCEGLSLCQVLSVILLISYAFLLISFLTLAFFYDFPHTPTWTDDLVLEKERYKDIGDDLDTAFVELILKE